MSAIIAFEMCDIIIWKCKFCSRVILRVFVAGRGLWKVVGEERGMWGLVFFMTKQVGPSRGVTGLGGDVVRQVHGIPKAQSPMPTCKPHTDNYKAEFAAAP